MIDKKHCFQPPCNSDHRPYTQQKNSSLHLLLSMKFSCKSLRWKNAMETRGVIGHGTSYGVERRREPRTPRASRPLCPRTGPSSLPLTVAQIHISSQVYLMKSNSQDFRSFNRRNSLSFGDNWRLKRVSTKCVL